MLVMFQNNSKLPTASSQCTTWRILLKVWFAIEQIWLRRVDANSNPVRYNELGYVMGYWTPEEDRLALV
jgi:hypothetical protein